MRVCCPRGAGTLAHCRCCCCCCSRRTAAQAARRQDCSGGLGHICGGRGDRLAAQHIHAQGVCTRVLRCGMWAQQLLRVPGSPAGAAAFACRAWRRCCRACRPRSRACEQARGAVAASGRRRQARRSASSSASQQAATGWVRRGGLHGAHACLLQAGRRARHRACARAVAAGPLRCVSE